MLHSFLKTAVRHLLRRKAHAFTSVFGLAIALAACLVIWQYVQFELSYDNFHRNGDLIYRTLFSDYVNGEKVASSPRFGYGLGPALLQDLPEVNKYVRTHGMGGDQAVVTYWDDRDKSVQFREESILFVDSTFLEVFSFGTIDGNPSTALDDPSSIVLTESTVRRYFGNGVNPLGKTLTVHTSYWMKGDFVVSAVVQDVPPNSHLHFDFLIPIHDLLQVAGYREPGAQWDWVNFITYVEMHPGTDIQNVNLKTDALLTKYTGPNEPGTFIFTFEPLQRIHLSEREAGSFSSIYFFILISIMVLVIAWINYINLTTARAAERVREIGVKKVLGVSKRQLAIQFIIESCLINFISLFAAVALAIMLFPVVEAITGRQLSFDFMSFRIWTVLASLFLIGSLASGLYPAFVLSSFRITNIMKGNVVLRRGVSPFRKGLVVFQFMTSLFLITGTLTIYRQIEFMRDGEEGLHMDQMLVVNGPRIVEEQDWEQRLLAFKNELLGYAITKDVATSGSVPGSGFNLVTGITRPGVKTREHQIPTGYIVGVDFDFPSIYNLEMISGRSWDPALQSDYHSVLINEEALKTFGLGNADHALTEMLIVSGEDTVAIAGVFKNVHWSSLQTPYVPMVLLPHKVDDKYFSIRMDGNFKEAIAITEDLYKKHFPGNPFDYFFLDDFFDRQYKSDQEFGTVINMFTLLAVVIAGLGLSGLASLITAQKFKEISIRKVLGASIRNIVQLLTWQHVKLMLIASVLALPFSVYFMSQWLENFAFRISLSLDLFVLPAVILFLIAIGAVSFQTIRGALLNPVNNLRTE